MNQECLITMSTPQDTDAGKLLTFQRKRRPFNISGWFAKLAHVLSRDRLTISPTGFLLVLLNEDDVQVYRYGSNALIHDAVLAARDYEQHRLYPESEKSPQERRDSRKELRARQAAEQAAHETAHPYACSICGYRRFATASGLNQHRRRCEQKARKYGWPIETEGTSG